MADVDRDMPFGVDNWDARLSQRAKTYIRAQTKSWVTRMLPNLEGRERIGSRRRAKRIRVLRREKWEKIRKDTKVSLGKLLGATKVLLGRSMDKDDPGWAWKAFTHNKWADIWQRSGAGAAGPTPFTIPPPEEQEGDESDESFSVDEGGSDTSASTSS